MPKISVPISSDAFKRLSDYITFYSREIHAKNRLFVERLASIGIPVVDAQMGAFKGDSERGHSTYIEVSSGEDICSARLIVQNKDILFIEFGAGIRYNNTKKHNPLASELGYGVGSYPNQKHAFDKNGWFYEDHGVKVHSYGTEASMPLQSATVEIISQIRDIAREVFKFEYNG